MDKKETPKFKKEASKSTRYGFSWWMKNLLIAAALYMLCPQIVKMNPGYQWLIDGYAKSNLKAIKEISEFNFDQKLEAKLGYDYAFIEMIRKSTPESAVVFYPSREDFTDTSVSTGVSFNGNLCDKLSAVRFLYPRRIVIKKELGKTSWSKKISHVAIINGHGRELLPYATPPSTLLTVLPTDSVEAMKLMIKK